MMSCFAEGFITSTISVDNLDNWGSCRAKKTSACQQLESAFNVFFDQSKMQSIAMFKALVDPVKDTVSTCKEAYATDLTNFGSWVLGTLQDPEIMMFTITTSFFKDDVSLAIADNFGDLVNNLFVEYYYFGAGDNLGHLLNDIFGSPSTPVDSSTFLL